MTDSFCGYTGDRDQALVALLYDDGEDALERAPFAAHLMTCARCRDELAALRGVRAQLGTWAPPEPAFAVTNGNPRSRNPQWWRQIPVWAQVAAALLVLGVSAGIANLDVRYDATGISVRTGWSTAAPSAPAAASAPSTGQVVVAAPQRGDDAAAWRADLAALERQLKAELHPTRVTDAGDKDLLRRVRVLVDESEKRQQRELALRVAEVIRDVSAQRQADLVKIDRTLGAVQNNLGVEVMKDRQRLNSLLIRTSGRQ